MPTFKKKESLALAQKTFVTWIDYLAVKKTMRKKSMLRKVVSVKGDPATIRRMFFRDWVKWIFQRRMETKMLGIREKIANRTQNRKAGAAAGYTVSQLTSTVDVIKMTEVSVRSIKEMGSFTDEDQAKIEDGQKSILELKEKCVTALNKLQNPLVPASDESENLDDYFETLITETDIQPGNLDFAKALLRHVKLDYGTLCEDRGLLAVAACDGSLGYLEAMLENKETRCDAVEVVSSCMFSQEFRIPLVALVMKHADKLKLPEVSEDLVDAWNEFFADIASKKRAIAREDRTGRVQLLRAMAHYDGIPVDLDAEGPDCQTVLSRAAHEGDAELVKMLLGVPGANVNRVQSDNTTTLIQAVFSGNVDTVKAVLAHPGVDTTHKSDDGSALALAQGLKRDPSIINMLKSGRGSDAEVSSLHTAPTFPPQALKKELQKAKKAEPKKADAPVKADTARKPEKKVEAQPKKVETARRASKVEPPAKKVEAVPASLPGLKPAKTQSEAKPMHASPLGAKARQDMLKNEINPAMLAKLKKPPVRKLSKV